MIPFFIFLCLKIALIDCHVLSEQRSLIYTQARTRLVYIDFKLYFKASEHRFVMIYIIVI